MSKFLYKQLKLHTGSNLSYVDSVSQYIHYDAVNMQPQTSRFFWSLKQVVFVLSLQVQNLHV